MTTLTEHHMQTGHASYTDNGKRTAREEQHVAGTSVVATRCLTCDECGIVVEADE